MVSGNLPHGSTDLIEDNKGGDRISQLDPKDIPQQSRQQIMKLIIDLETQIYERTNLFLIDLSPQSVYAVSDSVLFINFEHAL